MCKYLIVMMLTLLPGCLAAAPRERGDVCVEDTLVIRFPVDGITVNMDYADNEASWDAFEQVFNEHFAGASPRHLQLDIYSGASPEGPARHNRWLGENRGQALRWLVRERMPGRVGSIIVHNEGARWEGLFEAVAASSEPWRDEVLHIIAQPPTDNDAQLDHRELKLRALQGGTVWPQLRDRYLAPLRSGATAILSYSTSRDTVVVRDTVMMAPPMLLPSIIFAGDDGSLRRVSDSTQVAPPIEHNPKLRQPVWAMRTNLPLLGFGGTPNLQLEFSLGHKDKWSLNLEGWWSWWVFSRNAYANEMIYGSIELRRWLGHRWRRHTLSGWHLGLAVGGGYGDLEWRSKGYQAEVYSGFLNIGYQGRFGRRKHWSFDVGIGLGYAYVPYRRYDGSSIFPVGKEERYDDHLMWQETRQFNWMGPVHFNISIGYVFNQKDAAYKRRRALARDAARNAVLHRRDSLIARERFERDSIRVADKQREQEIQMLPRKERRQALAAFDAEKRQRLSDAQQGRKDAKLMAKVQKQQARYNARQARERALAERDSIRAELKAAKQYWKQLSRKERRAIKQEVRADEAQAKHAEAQYRRQAKLSAKEARRQNKMARKEARIRARIDAKHQKNLDRMRFDMEKANNKYHIK